MLVCADPAWAGRRPFFSTGTDEHGQKVQDAALKRGLDPQTQADEMVVRFQHAWERLHIAHDDFIRTTQPRHVRVVEAVLQALWEQGDIYAASIQGWYCVPDERFWTEKDLVEGDCPDCGRPVEQLVEAQLFLPHERLPGLAGRVHPRSPRLHPARDPAQRGAGLPAPALWATSASRALSSA